MKNSLLAIAKKYCKEYKCKFESLNNSVLIVSVISNRKIANIKDGKHYKDWDITKHRSFTKCIVHLDGDVEIMERVGNTYYPVNTTYKDL